MREGEGRDRERDTGRGKGEKEGRNEITDRNNGKKQNKKVD